MKIPVLWRKLLRDLWHRLGSLIALIFIVGIGTGIYIGSLSLFYDLDGARARYYADKRMADFTVDLKRAPVWTIDDVAQMPNVRHAEGRVVQAAMIDLDTEPLPITAVAISLPAEPRPVLNDVLLRTGTWFSDKDAEEVLLNDAFAKAHGLRPGARLRVRILDRQHEVLVVGTAMSPEFVYVLPPGGGMVPDPARSGVLYFAEEFLQQAADLDGAFNQIVGKAHRDSRAELDVLLKTIEDQLDAYGVIATQSIYEQPSAIFLADELAGLKVSATVTPVIFLGVAALVLNILLGRMVAQQRNVIGTLKALGYSSGAITRHYLGYGLIFGLIGGAAGVGFGIFMQESTLAIYQQFYEMPDLVSHTYYHTIFHGILISVVCALLGTIQGVRNAAKLQPAEAMRPPRPEGGNRILLERVPIVWNRLPFRLKLILRSIFRNPFRSAVVMLAACVSTALIFAYISLAQSFDYMLNYQFAEIMHQDVTVTLSEPRHAMALDEIDRFATVSGVEGQLAIGADLANGPYQKRVGILGVPRGNRLHTPLDDAKRPIVVPDAGLVLTDKLARMLRVGVGDTVTLRPLIGERRETTAPVVAVVTTFLGLSAYADLDYLSGLIGEERVVNSVLVTTETSGEIRPEFIADTTGHPAVIAIDERRRILDQMNEIFGQMMGVMITIMVFIAGSIAFGAVLNAALVSLSERQREVGTLRVIGYSPLQVMGIFAGESLIVNAIGIVLGMFAGIGLLHATSAAYDTELYRFPVIVRPDLLVLSAVLMAGFIGVAQLVVYRLIRKLKWTDVLQVKE